MGRVEGMVVNATRWFYERPNRAGGGRSRGRRARRRRRRRAGRIRDARYTHRGRTRPSASASPWRVRVRRSKGCAKKMRHITDTRSG